ncbi:MAG: hypothetical protein GY794_03800 [bacterium]|nr:hypothetical protein [bacterium]
MRYPIGHTVVLTFLLIGSATLILGSCNTLQLSNTAQNPPQVILPETEITPRLCVSRPPVAKKTKVVTKTTRPETRTVRMLVTAYCPCKKCCGRFSDYITASGKSVYSNHAMFVAADTRLLKFGTMVSIPGYYGAQAVPVLDRGSAIRGSRLDVFFLSHKRALKWGRQYLNVTIRRDNH